MPRTNQAENITNSPETINQDPSRLAGQVSVESVSSRPEEVKVRIVDPSEDFVSSEVPSQNEAGEPNQSL